VETCGSPAIAVEDAKLPSMPASAWFVGLSIARSYSVLHLLPGFPARRARLASTSRLISRAEFRSLTATPRSFTIGYKYNHISNGYRSSINPGVDLQMIFAGFSIFR
jgi:Lipid A 3-O-deacylase (PagL)